MMEKDNEKRVVNNDQYKERFQFCLWVNEDIICQRYFKINGYNSDSLVSEELFDVLEGCVDMIKGDLKYKSFLYQSIVGNRPIKLNGFVSDEHINNLEDMFLVCDSKISGEVTLSDGTVINKEYFTYSDDVEDLYNDTELLEPYDVTFKFVFLVDDKPVYERIWDGSQYPKHVRNSVDLVNSNTYYNLDNVSFNSSESISKYLKYGRKDLLYHMIKKICDVMSGGFDNPNAYTKTMEYDDTTYNYSTYNSEFVKGYSKWMQNKTRKHFAEINRDKLYKEYGGLTQGEWGYIEKYL